MNMKSVLVFSVKRNCIFTEILVIFGTEFTVNSRMLL